MVKTIFDKVFQLNTSQLIRVDFQILVSQLSLSSKNISVNSTSIFLEGTLTSFARSSLLFSMALKVFHKTSIEFKTGSDGF